MEAEGIGDDQAVGGHDEWDGRWQAEKSQVVGAGTEGSVLGVAVLEVSRDQATPIFPDDAPPSQAMGAGHVGQRSILRFHVLQIKPALDARVKGIGMEGLLGVGSALA